jgi:hypothetical protein
MINQYGLLQLEMFGRSWFQKEGEIIKLTMSTVLEWLGVVKIGRDEAGQAVSFALTELGAELVGVPNLARQSWHSIEKPLLVQPNFEIMIFSPKVDLLWTLLKFAHLKKLDQVSIYTIDRASVRRGMESGLGPAMMLEWLTQRNLQPLPQNLVVSVQDWGKDFRRVMVERTTLLEVEDPMVLDELLKTKQYAAYFVRRLSPNAALIKLPEPKENPPTKNLPDEPLKSFRKELRRAGFFAT